MSGFTIMGARGDPEATLHLLARLQSIESGQVLALDAGMVCGPQHLQSAAEHALRAFERGTSSANDVMMETMLYASGERQIARAQEKMSFKPGGREVALVLFGARPEEVLRVAGLERDDSVLECDEGKLRRYGISEAELRMSPPPKAQDLVLERVAFVEILKR